MRVVERLAQREATWRELDRLLLRFEGARPVTPPGPKPEVVWIDDDLAPPPTSPKRRGKLGADEVIRLGELYRAACADLMLAEAHDLPRDTVAYLHGLVARAHNAVYRARGFRFSQWAGDLFATVPRRLRSDPALGISAFVFYGTFLLFFLLSALGEHREIANKVAGEAFLEQLEQMYEEPVSSRSRNDSLMAGFYVQHNASIGLQCFALGLFFGIGSLYLLVSNAMVIGVAFGHMARSPHAVNFFTFVTAHGPFELTAIVFSGAAGLRLGWGLIDTRGLTRLASLRREAIRALPTVGAAVFLFALAAFLEGFVSASPLPYAAKAAIALGSAGLLVAYLVLGGRSGTPRMEAPAS